MSSSDLSVAIAAAFAEPRAAIAAQLEAALAELAPAREAAAAAKAAAEAANHLFENVGLRARRAVRETEAAAPGLLRVVDDARRVRDQAAGRATLAKGQLDNLIWRISCLRDDLDQIGRAVEPPPLGGAVVQIVERPRPPGPAEVETIVFPPGHPAGEAA